MDFRDPLSDTGVIDFDFSFFAGLTATAGESLGLDFDLLLGSGLGEGGGPVNFNCCVISSVWRLILIACSRSPEDT